VQQARAQMYFDRSDPTRGFGTPVLYTSTLESPLLVDRPGGTSGALLTDQPSGVATSTNAQVRAQLLDIVEDQSPNGATAQALSEWIRGTRWPDEPDQAWMIIHTYARDQAAPELRPLFAALKRAVRKGS
jgi:hypothetical protein